MPPPHRARVGDHTRARDEVQQSVGQAALLLSFILKGTDDGRERERRESLWRKPTHAQYTLDIDMKAEEGTERVHRKG